MKLQNLKRFFGGGGASVRQAPNQSVWRRPGTCREQRAATLKSGGREEHRGNRHFAQCKIAARHKNGQGDGIHRHPVCWSLIG